MFYGSTMVRIPDDFFGLHINKVATSQPIDFQTPWCELGQAWHRIWDNYTTWKLINTANGVYNWSRLDDVVNIVESHGKKMVMGIGSAPDWATGASTGGSQYSPYVPSDAAWITWVTAVATRFQGRIHAYELWNEPSAGTFWNGTPEQLVHLCSLAYPIIKSIDPDAIVVSPCCPGILSVPWFANLIKAGMANYCDVVAFHAYCGSNPPEYLAHLAECYLGVLAVAGVTKPLWDSESGWVDYVNQAGTLVATHTASDAMTDQQGSAYVSRQLLLTASYGLAKSFHYTADGQAAGTYLMKPTLLDYATRSIKQPAAYAFSYLAGLLPGGRIGKVQYNGSYYAMKGQTGLGESFAALWCRDWKITSVSAAAFHAKRATDCRGNVVSIAGDTVALSMEPVFLFS